MEDQSTKTVRGTAVTSADPDAFVLVLSQDFKQRLLWSTFSRGGAGRTVGVAMRQGVAALVATQDQAGARRPLITYEPVQKAPAGGASDTFLAVWPAP
jgi:hypothetical protein